MKRQRPWKVFVQQIGPSFSFATEDRAHARALELSVEYATIEVWHSVMDGGNLRERWEYRDGQCFRQFLSSDLGWVDEAGSAA